MSRPSTQRLLSFCGFVSYMLQYGYSWVNYAANVPNVAAPCAWSAKHYHKETHYRNNDSRDKILHSTTALAYYIFDDYWTCSVLVKIYKNILGGLIPQYLRLNTVLINVWPMYQMFQHPAPGALTFMIYQETHTATMTYGSKCYILYYCALCYVLKIPRLGLF